MDIEKSFDSLDHNFLVSTLEKCDFGKNSISLIKSLLRDQESSVIHGGKTAKYFSVGRSVPQDVSFFRIFIYFNFRYLTFSYKIET